MQTIIWAFGAMLVLMLIMAFLPVGLTLRGKIFVVLAGFALALGGLAAVASFPLWQTGLMVLLLVLVAAYIMDSRLAAVIYNQDLDSFEDDSEESLVTNELFKNAEGTTEFDLVDLAELGVNEPSLNKAEEIDDISIELQPQMEIEVDQDDAELIEEDISILEDQLEIVIDETNNDPVIENGYLSDIENLLLDDSVEDMVSEDEDWLEKLGEESPVIAEDETISLENEENELEELFFAMEEAAAGKGDNQKELDLKKVQLQK